MKMDLVKDPIAIIDIQGKVCILHLSTFLLMHLPSLLTVGRRSHLTYCRRQSVAAQDVFSGKEVLPFLTMNVFNLPLKPITSDRKVIKNHKGFILR